MLVLALGGACTRPAGDVADPAVDQVPAERTTSSSTTTTTTVPLPADVQDLVATTTMTERARRIFLAASPAIEEPAAFAANCGVDASQEPAERQTHTQGCYVSRRIHLRAPDRAEGRDLLYVVAAHELLHAVYALLAPSERARVDAEVEAARAAGNDRLEERLEPYGSGPTLANEMHSILGSEFDGLSPALEAHYAQFFTNRAAVVAARQRTLGVKEDGIRALRAELDDLEARIATLRATQEQLRAAGDVRGYNANIDPINALISRYNAQVSALNALIAEYNGLLGG